MTDLGDSLGGLLSTVVIAGAAIKITDSVFGGGSSKKNNSIKKKKKSTNANNNAYSRERTMFRSPF